MDAGRQWFLHAIYTVRSARNAGRGIGKRSAQDSTLHHALLNPLAGGRVRRDAGDVEGVGEGGKGTNIARVQMDRSLRDGDVSVGTNVNDTSATEVPLIPIVVSLLVVVILCVLLVLFFVRRKRKRQSPPPSPTQTITVVAKGGGGQSRVHSTATTSHAHSNDNTEV